MVVQVDVRELATAIESGAVVIDVREPFEYASGHVPGAVLMPMHLVPLKIAELPAERDLHVICASGNRSWQVCHFLGQHGIPAKNVAGGTGAWRAAGMALETGAPNAVAAPSDGGRF